jgi:hypothetical protein
LVDQEWNLHFPSVGRRESRRLLSRAKADGLQAWVTEPAYSLDFHATKTAMQAIGHCLKQITSEDVSEMEWWRLQNNEIPDYMEPEGLVDPERLTSVPKPDWTVPGGRSVQVMYLDRDKAEHFLAEAAKSGISGKLVDPRQYGMFGYDVWTVEQLVRFMRIGIRRVQGTESELAGIILRDLEKYLEVANKPVLTALKKLCERSSTVKAMFEAHRQENQGIVLPSLFADSAAQWMAEQINDGTAASEISRLQLELDRATILGPNRVRVWIAQAFQDRLPRDAHWRGRHTALYLIPR